MAGIEEESSYERISKLQSPEVVRTGYASDGYETASDAELNDVISGSEKYSNNICKADIVNITEVKEEEQQKNTKSSASELNEKALTEANDAKLEGNSLFKEGFYEEALLKYELAIQIAPDGPSSTDIHSICCANRAACFSKLGKFDETIKECTKAIDLNPTYIKSLLRRGEAHEKLEQYEESIADMTKVVELDQSNEQARNTIIRLKPLADEKREKMKEEMIGKLKEMGNSILGRFGMSVDNFKDMTKVVELDQSNEQARNTIIRLKPLADEKREKMKEEMIGKLKEMGNSILGRFGMSVDNFKGVKDPQTGSYSFSFQQ